jgi:hypothetical protein
LLESLFARRHCHFSALLPLPRKHIPRGPQWRFRERPTLGDAL